MMIGFLYHQVVILKYCAQILTPIYMLKEGKVIALSAIDSLLIALKNAPKQLNKDMLNVMGFKYIYVGDVDSEVLIALGEACIDLINGEMGHKYAHIVF